MDENKLFINFIKAVVSTIAIFIITVWGLYSIVGLAFKNMSVEQSNTWIIICMCIAIIFTILFCTFTILDEIKRIKK